MFSLPTFNVSVSIWRSTAIPPGGPPAVIVMGNLAWGRRSAPLVSVGQSTGMTLLLPALTDVRGDDGLALGDIVEVPSGSSRFYHADYVDDIGKGFLNEHRAAVLRHGSPWPVPTP